MVDNLTPDHEKAATSFREEVRTIARIEFPELVVYTDNWTDLLLQRAEELGRQGDDKAQQIGHIIDISSAKETLISLLIFGNEMERLNSAFLQFNQIADRHGGKLTSSNASSVAKLPLRDDHQIITQDKSFCNALLYVFS